MPTPTLPRVLALAAPLLATSCALTIQDEVAPRNAEPRKAASQADGPANPVELARVELELARLKAEGSVQVAESALHAAELELAAARTALESFAGGREVRVREATASVQRARVRLEEQRAELGELEAMYAAEEFAETTKELVLARGKNQLAQAEEALAIEGLQLARLADVELPAEEQAKRLALVRAEAALGEARRALEAARLKARLDVLRAEQALHEAEEESAGGGA